MWLDIEVYDKHFSIQHEQKVEHGVKLYTH